MCIDNQSNQKKPRFSRFSSSLAVGDSGTQHSGKHTHTGLLRARGHTLGLAMSQSRGVTLAHRIEDAPHGRKRVHTLLWHHLLDDGGGGGGVGAVCGV